jgi:hypothetical protein
MTDTAPPTDSHDVIARLRAANPAEPDSRRAQSSAARAALERILADSSPDDVSPSPLARLRGRLHTRSARGLAAVGATLIVGTGGALAATDPMGWWNTTPDQAYYATNPSVHVATPSAVKIRCRIEAGGNSICTPTSMLGQGLTYVRVGSVRKPQHVSLFTRRSFLAHVSAARAQGRISATSAVRLRADIAAVPDSFFTMMTFTADYGGFGIESRTASGKTLVPPAGTPAFLVCQDATAGGLTCRSLNGNTIAPVGAGVYAVNHTLRPWHVVAATRPASESRLLRDIPRFDTVLLGGSHR